MMAHLPAGQRAPDFKLTTLEGQTIALSDYRGQPVLLVFLRHLG
jgi:peroxiredoxin